MDRREFLYQAGLFSTSALVGMPAAAARQWSEGRIRHLIPLSNHDSILIKASFAEPQSGPHLKIGASVFPGRRRDSQGRFWSFHATGLESDTEYELLLQSRRGRPVGGKLAAANGACPGCVEGAPAGAALHLRGRSGRCAMAERRMAVPAGRHPPETAAPGTGLQSRYRDRHRRSDLLRPVDFAPQARRAARGESGADLRPVRQVRPRQAAIRIEQRDRADAVPGRTDREPLRNGLSLDSAHPDSG